MTYDPNRSGSKPFAGSAPRRKTTVTAPGAAPPPPAPEFETDPNAQRPTWAPQGSGQEWKRFNQQSMNDYFHPQAPDDITKMPGPYENWYDKHKGAYDETTASRQYWNGVQGKFSGGSQWNPHEMSDAYGRKREYFDTQQPGVHQAYEYGDKMGDVGDRLGDRTGGEGVMDESLNYFRGPSATGDEFDYYREGLRGPSRSEALYDSGGDGLDAAYSRQLDKRSKDMERRMAATGVFGSGATARNLQELNADTIANQSRDWADLAKQADDAYLARTGASRDFAGNVDKYRLQAGEDIGRTGKDLSETEIDRLNKEAGVYKDAGELGLAGDAEERNKADLYFRGAKDVDEMGKDKAAQDLDYYRTGGDLAGQTDVADDRRMGAGQRAAKDDNEAFYDRYNTGMNDRYREANAKADITNQILNLATTEDKKMGMEIIANMVAQGQLTAQEGLDMANNWKESAETFDEFASKAAGGGK